MLGWSRVPEAGDEFQALADERDARHLAQERETRMRAAELVAAKPAIKLEEILQSAPEGEAAELKIILKADTQGSVEAVEDALNKLSTDEVQVRVLRSGVGAVTENDVNLAQASEAIVMGFSVRPDAKAREVAEREGIDLRLYTVIYQAVDDIKQALSGMLTPEEKEAELGRGRGARRRSRCRGWAWSPVATWSAER